MRFNLLQYREMINNNRKKTISIMKLNLERNIEVPSNKYEL